MQSKRCFVPNAIPTIPVVSGNGDTVKEKETSEVVCACKKSLEAYLEAYLEACQEAREALKALEACRVALEACLEACPVHGVE